MGAAKRLFANPKNSETTLKELARLADVTPSSLYTYFSTREEIVGAIVEDSWDWLNGEMEQDGAERMEPKRLLRQFCGMYFSEMIVDANLSSLIVQYPHAVPGIKEKLDAFSAILSPGLECLSKKYNNLPVDEHARKAQTAILILGCLALRYFNSNVDLGFSDKDILNAFRTFLPADEQA